jgi:Raf kinase inhibitor-like YbhB/YbcL family protein
MRTTLTILLSSAALLAVSCANEGPVLSPNQTNDLVAVEAQRTGDARLLAINQVPSPVRLRVRSDTFADGRGIPYENSDYGHKRSPHLSWSGAPETTRSFVVLMEDPDAAEPKPFIHWVIYNIPANVTELRPGVAPEMKLLEFDDKALQGKNSRGSIGYMGPRPPYDSGTHHYHFQVFALSNTLPSNPGMTRDQVLAAIRNNVVASGSIVGEYNAANP